MTLSKRQQIIAYVVLTVAAFFVIFPLLFSLMLSLSDNKDIMAGQYIPSAPHFENYTNAFQIQPLLHYLKNSAIVAAGTTVLKIAIALCAAFGVVFLEFRGKKFFFALFMATMMIPSEVLVVSNFHTVRAWNLLNTFPGLMLPELASTFGIFLLRQNFKQLPWELREASQVAGISDFRFFTRIAVPCVKNSIVTLAIYNFLVSWNSYLWPLLSTTNDTVRMVQMGLRQLKSIDQVADFGLLSAAAIIVSLPTLLLIFFAHNRLQEGLTKGALK